MTETDKDLANQQAKLERAAALEMAAKGIEDASKGWIDEEGLTVYPAAEWCADFVKTLITDDETSALEAVKREAWNAAIEAVLSYGYEMDDGLNIVEVVYTDKILALITDDEQPTEKNDDR